MRAADEDLSEGVKSSIHLVNFRACGEGEKGEVLAEHADVVLMLTCDFGFNAEPVGDVEAGGEVTALHAEALTDARRCIGSDVVVAERNFEACGVRRIRWVPLRGGSGTSHRKEY